MVSCISKISKGTLMDQIYLPKQRMQGFAVGSYVLIKPLEAEKKEIKPFFYNTVEIEPIKVEIIKNILGMIEEHSPENIIITGSFLEKGFSFNDIDILIVTEKEIDKEDINEMIASTFGLVPHIITISFKALLEGINTDPLYQLMLTRYVSLKRVIMRVNAIVNYKLLDLHLLKSKALIDNFDYLDGREKYAMTRNIISIRLFLKKDKITKEKIDSMIERKLGISTKNIKGNVIINKADFLKKYKEEYASLSSIVLEGIQHGAKQKKDS